LYIRDYLAKLEAAAERKSCFIDWYAAPASFKYLDLDFILEAQSIFDRAESVLNNCSGEKERLVGRLRHARLPLDRATVILFPKLKAEWTARGHKADTMPLDRELIGRRALDTWYAVIEEGRIPAEKREGAKKVAYGELRKYVTFPSPVLPGK